MQSTSCEMLGRMTHKPGIKTARRNSNNLRYADETTLMAKVEEELKTPLMRLKSWVQTLHSKNEDHGIRSHRFMANRRGKVETVTDFTFLVSKITVNGACSHEIKRHLLLGRKAITNLESILKRRDITWLTKLHLVKAMVFPVVMYRCETWNIKKAECPRIDAFKLWCCRRLLRVPWTVRRSNQSVLKEINPDYSLEELMLKLQYFGHIMRRANSLEKTLVLGKIEDRGEGGDKG